MVSRVLIDENETRYPGTIQKVVAFTGSIMELEAFFFLEISFNEIFTQAPCYSNLVATLCTMLAVIQPMAPMVERSPRGSQS
jgi:hypothetical protein